MRTQLGLVLSILAFGPASAYADKPAKNSPPSESVNAKTKLIVKSSAFPANGAIPMEYTCDGTEKSPPLAWSNVPANTKSIAVLVEDPDAPKGTFTHWIVTDLPPTTTELAAGAALPEGAVAAKNDKGKAGYAGPCPPSGTHHYHFHIYALDTTIAKPDTKSQFVATIDGHVVAEGELIGVYEKAKNR